jgi:DNA-binding LytR/AlgR family response regulator
MDAVFYAPHETIKVGENEAVLRLSSHHGFLHLNYPVHYLILQRYANPSREILRAYGPSLLTFGVFLLGAIYFGVSALRRVSTGNSILLFVLSLLAIAQLLLETSRGLFAYDYPFQDLRLVLIAAGAASFGLCLYVHVVFKFIIKNRAAYILAGLIATALVVIIAASFDAKALLGLGAPTLAGACIAISAAVRNKPAARAYSVALSLFLVIMAVLIGKFLDAAFYYSTSALLLFLIGQQAMFFAKERALRIDANDRASRLELALELARQKDAPERVTIHNAGKTEIIAASDIIYCKGAGDYVEIVLSSGANHLHLAKLHELESELPQTFLRIHRSYIVNTNFVQSLTREANGVGALTLNNGETVPVSRRILPNVRSALQ